MEEARVKFYGLLIGAFMVFVMVLRESPIWTILVTGILLALLYMRKLNKDDAIRGAKAAYDKLRQTVSIPEDVRKVRYTASDQGIFKCEYYAWVERNSLCLFPAAPLANSNIQIELVNIPVESIDSYYRQGEVFHENRLTGGGGGGSSLTGAIAGGMAAGGVGAIIGSRKKVKPIKSDLITHDSRMTIFKYVDGNKQEHSLHFDFDDFDTICILLPSKSLEFIKALNAQALIDERLNHHRGATSIPDRIRDLAKLKDDGLITESEFQEKKTLLLSKI